MTKPLPPFDNLIKSLYTKLALKQGLNETQINQQSKLVIEAFKKLDINVRQVKNKSGTSGPSASVKCTFVGMKKDGSPKNCRKNVKNIEYTDFCPEHTLLADSQHPDVYFSKKLDLNTKYLQNISSLVRSLNLNVVLNSTAIHYSVHIQCYEKPHSAIILSKITNQDKWVHGIIGFLKATGKDIKYTEDKETQDFVVKSLRIPMYSEADANEIKKGFNTLVDSLVVRSDNTIGLKS